MTDSAQTADTAVPADASAVSGLPIPSFRLPPSIPPAPCIPPRCLPPGRATAVGQWRGHQRQPSGRRRSSAELAARRCRARRLDLARSGRANAQLAGQHGRSSVDRIAAGTRDLDAHVDRMAVADHGHDPRRWRRSGRPAGRADGNRLGSRYRRKPWPPGQLSEVPLASSLGEAIGPISATLGDGGLAAQVARTRPRKTTACPAAAEAATRWSCDSMGPDGRRWCAPAAARRESEKAVAWRCVAGRASELRRQLVVRSSQSPKCHGAVRNQGSNASKIAATSLALLPFLGTGQTHREGHYKRTIDLGLKFLVRTMQSQRERQLVGSGAERCTATAWPRSCCAKRTA